ncbi:hypothetical protein DL95DRAFT_519047 [Leptodontidium sp. 2 PMI_412]|nr:hypothetical protein DL95DRAFT_519047 [Leptodontidium sp. 2 PMI_412]
MKFLLLLFASTLALAQDPEVSDPRAPPPPPESSERDYRIVVSTFEITDTITTSTLSVRATRTEDPGPAEPGTLTLTTIRTLHSTFTEWKSAGSTSWGTIGGASPSPSHSTSATSVSATSTKLSATTTSSTSSASKTPGVSTTPTPSHSAAPPPPPPKKGIGTTSIVLIVFGIVCAITMVGSGAFFMKKRRARERVEERNAAYRNRDWNSARPPISSPLNTANLNELNSMTTALRSTTPSNLGPVRPARPASLTESVQESMRMTPVAGMRKVSGSVRSGGTASTIMSGTRFVSPEPLNIVKEGTAGRDRSETYSSVIPNFGDYHTRSSSGIDSTQLDELRALEQELRDQAAYLKNAEENGQVYPLLMKSGQSGNSDGPSGHGHPTPPSSRPDRKYIIPRQPRFSDLDEDDDDVRSARRTSAQRKLDGESIRSTSTSPPIYDSIAARAEKQRLIAQKQRIVAERQKKTGGPSKNITDFTAGPMPNYTPPPPPGPQPLGYF